MKADNKNILIAALTIATLLTAGGALAANEPQPVQQKSTARQIAVDKEFGKISADGSSAFQDLTLTRLAIFDGRIDAAKKYIDKADTALGKAKTDEALFVKAEADLKSTTTKGAKAKKSAGAVAPVTDQQKDQKEELVTWLPVDGSITINDDYTASAPKTAAIAEANKRLANGDKKGAIEKLKLADINIDFVLVALPLDETIAKVHQAASLINDGKYYEASQIVKQVQDSVRSDVVNIVGVPTH